MYEFEVRFYEIYKSNLFVEFLKDFFKTTYLETIEDTSYVFDNSIRYICNSEGSISKYRKISLSDRKTKIYKYSVSEEIKMDVELDTDEETLRSTSNLTRKRVRDIYQIESDLQLHITKINGKEYEVELEREVPSIEDSKVFEMFSVSFDRFMDNISPHLNSFQSFIFNFNGKSVKNPPGVMDRRVISRPRDFIKNDLITTSRFTDIPKGIPDGYTLTIKGNGIPVLIFFHKGYLYMSQPDKNFFFKNKYSSGTIESAIILGEYFEDSNIFAPFDILYWSRQKNIREHPDHLERIERVKEILKRNREVYEDIFTVFIKPFLPVGKTPISFAKAYSKIKSYKYPFGDDGMILTPQFTSHNPGVPPQKERRLGLHPETCKIKPWHEQSIDFRVDLKSQEVYTSASTKSYNGTSKDPFDSKVNVDWDSIPDHFDEKIVELRPTMVDNTIVMVFSRGREDKPAPNSLNTANENWALIKDPLPEKVFQAKSFHRLRYQNNRVKKDLIDKIPSGSIVVDIGTGRGGDILKYNHIAKVVLCIEPDDDYRSELYSRLESLKPILKTKYIVLNAMGQETDKIMKAFLPIRESYSDSNVAVVSMLSMTFFWKNRSTLDFFENTLTSIAKTSNGAKFYFHTIEGTRFRTYFLENKNKISNYGIQAVYDPEATKYGVGIPGKIKIALFDTIVGKATTQESIIKPQVEFLVDLKDLKCLREINVTEGVIESYLTPEELRYAQCHVYGSAKIVF